MGIDFNAVLNHTFDAEELRDLPRLLSAACAPRLAKAIIDLETCEAELYNRRDRKLPTLADFKEEAWYVQPTRLALYRDGAGKLTSKVPPPVPSSPERAAILRKPHPGVMEWSHPAPVAAWRTLSVKENWATGNWFEIEGEYIRLAIGPRTLEISRALRWRTFLAEPALQSATRRVCHEVARVVGSLQALYLPDRYDPIDDIIAGATIEEIVAEINLKHGPPAPRLTVFPEDVTLDAIGDVYYLDTFADL